jgi:hypothetical protein
MGDQNTELTIIPLTNSLWKILVYKDKGEVTGTQFNIYSLKKWPNISTDKKTVQKTVEQICQHLNLRLHSHQYCKKCLLFKIPRRWYFCCYNILKWWRWLLFSKYLLWKLTYPGLRWVKEPYHSYFTKSYSMPPPWETIKNLQVGYSPAQTCLKLHVSIWGEHLMAEKWISQRWTSQYLNDRLSRAEKRAVMTPRKCA